MFYDKIVDSQRILYTPSDFAKESLLHLQETGTLVSYKKHKSSHSKLSSYLFFIVLKGTGELEYKGKSYALKEGDCVFVDCMDEYSHSNSESSWSLQWVHFNGSSMPGIYEKYLSRGGMPFFHPEKIKKYQSVLDSIYAIASTDDYIRDMKINALLAQLLTNIMEMSWLPENQEMKKRGESQRFSLKDIKNFIDNNWNSDISLDGLSSQFFINKFYLEKIFKNQYGRTINSYINEKRITQAKKLLRFSDDSNEQIAYNCGFESSNYFCRKFKAIEGITPGEFRRKWSQ